MAWGRETLYRDILFRSNLEAKWAAMWDLLGWSWIYEPMKIKRKRPDSDLKEGWNPDFLLEEWNTLVEVKPIKPGDPKTSPFGDRTSRKIELTVPEKYNVLLVGCIVPFSFKRSPGPVRFDYKNKKQYKEQFFHELIMPNAENIAGLPIGYFLERSDHPRLGWEPEWDLGVIRWKNKWNLTCCYKIMNENNSIDDNAADMQDNLLLRWAGAAHQSADPQHAHNSPLGPGIRGPRRVGGDDWAVRPRTLD